MAPRKTPPRERLSAADWEVAALDSLSESGLEGVAVERLARKLGVTKGSFYWHFADRDAILKAALARWEKSHTEQVIAVVSDVRNPRERLTRLIGLALTAGRSDQIHIALGASEHPLARAALARVTRRRLAYLESCYVELGRKRDEARRDAFFAYAVYVGLVHLHLEAPNEVPLRGAVDSVELERIVGRLVK